MEEKNCGAFFILKIKIPFFVYLSQLQPHCYRGFILLCIRQRFVLFCFLRSLALSGGREITPSQIVSKHVVNIRFVYAHISLETFTYALLGMFSRVFFFWLSNLTMSQTIHLVHAYRKFITSPFSTCSSKRRQDRP